MKLPSNLIILLTLGGLLGLTSGATGDETKPGSAFPGAEGYGSMAPGGRGGQLVAVTNLNAKGPGSLQAACDAKGPRIVIFKVSETSMGM